MAGTFTARYDSECSSCFGQIWAGDEAGWVGGEVVCEGCYEVSE
ncbi:hypothetical protein [Streptomyces sp. t39]|nr:hypothetical protein [Streptomyces sp. t39]